MAPVGALLGGAMADRLGAPIAVATWRSGQHCRAIGFGRQLPVFRGEARQLIIAQAMGWRRPAEENDRGEVVQKSSGDASIPPRIQTGRPWRFVSARSRAVDSTHWTAQLRIQPCAVEQSDPENISLYGSKRSGSTACIFLQLASAVKD